jgi:adenylate cyclase
LKIKFGECVEFTPKRNYRGVKRIPIDRSGSLLVNFREKDPVKGKNSYPLHQVIHYGRFGDLYPTRIKPETFKDAIVIVGELSPGGADVEPIPLAPSYPMMAVHASVIDMVWKDDYLKDPGTLVELLFTLGFGLFMGLIFSLWEYRPASLVSFGFLLLYCLVCIFLFRTHNIFLPFIRPCSTLFLSYIFLILYIVGIKERERRKVRSIFLKSVSPRIGEEILRHYDHEAIWGVKKVVTILFVDIRGFTALSEALNARELVDFLDTYYDTVSQIIFTHDGVVNKFIGDAVMALFGAPLDLSDPEAKAVKAGLEIQNAVRDLNLNPILLKYQRKVHVGIGISAGEVVVGTVGRKKIRIEYTALGDNVNIADRLQGVAGPGEILINKTVYEKIMETTDPWFQEHNVQFHSLPPMMLRGKEKPVEVFKVEYAGVS